MEPVNKPPPGGRGYNLLFGTTAQPQEPSVAVWRAEGDKRMELRAIAEALKQDRLLLAEGPYADTLVMDEKPAGKVAGLAREMERRAGTRSTLAVLERLYDLLAIHNPEPGEHVHRGAEFSTRFYMDERYMRGDNPKPMTAGAILAWPEEERALGGVPTGQTGIWLRDEVELYRVGIALLRALNMQAYYGYAASAAGPSGSRNVYPVIAAMDHEEKRRLAGGYDDYQGMFLFSTHPGFIFGTPPIGVTLANDAVMQSFLLLGYAVDLSRKLGLDTLDAVKGILRQCHAGYIIEMIEAGMAFPMPIVDPMSGAVAGMGPQPVSFWNMLRADVQAILVGNRYLTGEQATAIRLLYARWEDGNDVGKTRLGEIAKVLVESHRWFPDGWQSHIEEVGRGLELITTVLPPWQNRVLSGLMRGMVEPEAEAPAAASEPGEGSGAATAGGGAVGLLPGEEAGWMDAGAEGVPDRRGREEAVPGVERAVEPPARKEDPWPTDPQELLDQAVRAGDLERITEALRRGADPAKPDKTGASPMVLAGLANNVEALELMGRRGG